MIPFTCSIQTRQIHREKADGGVGEIGSDYSMSIECFPEDSEKVWNQRELVVAQHCEYTVTAIP